MIRLILRCNVCHVESKVDREGFKVDQIKEMRAEATALLGWLPLSHGMDLCPVCAGKFRRMSGEG